MLTDRFGNEIKPGVVVTFPPRRGSDLSVIDGVVEEIRMDYPRHWQPQPTKQPIVYIRKFDGKATYTEILSRLTVVQSSGQSS